MKRLWIFSSKNPHSQRPTHPFFPFCVCTDEAKQKKTKFLALDWVFYLGLITGTLAALGIHFQTQLRPHCKPHWRDWNVTSHPTNTYKPEPKES